MRFQPAAAYLARGTENRRKNISVGNLAKAIDSQGTKGRSSNYLAGSKDKIGYTHESFQSFVSYKHSMVSCQAKHLVNKDLPSSVNPNCGLLLSTLAGPPLNNARKPSSLSDIIMVSWQVAIRINPYKF